MECKKYYIVKLIRELSEGGGEDFKTLKNLSSCLENHHDVTVFRQNNGLKMLLDFVDENYLILETLKVLAHCCTDNKTKLQILQWDSIPKICKLLKTLDDKETLKVVCKVVGNLCGNRLCRYSIHDDPEALDCIVACLGWSGMDDPFMNVYLKTLRSLSRSKEHCERMVERGVVRGVCSLLKRNLSSSIVREVLISITHFFKRWSNEVKVQFIEAETLKTMVKLVKNNNYVSNLVHQFILMKLLPNQEILKYFGTSGILNLFITSYEKSTTPEGKDTFLRAIYVCCREASNRAATLHDHHFLDVLLNSFIDPHCNHNLLLRTIICYKYNFEAINYLISHHLISSCIKLLSTNTSFNLAEMTSKLLYMGGEVASAVSINTPVSPSTFNQGYHMTRRSDDNGSESPCSSKSEHHSKPPLHEESELESANADTSDSQACSSHRLMFNEVSSEDEEVDKDDFLEEDKHLYELARAFELERRNKLVFNRVFSHCQQVDEEAGTRKRKTRSRICPKKIRLDSNFCLKSTLDTMVSPDRSSVCVREEESTQSCIINLISHLVGLPAAEKHLNRLESIRTLIYTIPVVSNNHKLAYVLAHVSQNPLYFKLLVSEMLLPMIDLFCKTSSDPSIFLNDFSLVTTNLSTVYRSNYAPTILRELLSADQTRLQCTISLCYLARKGSRGESYMTEAGVMEGLVNSMYDHKHPLRLLSITSYCHLLSSVSPACECDIEEDDDEEGEEEEEREYDVSFMLGQECIRSVKSKLVRHSEVFRVMFEGAFREASTHQVVVDGASPEAFRFFNESLLSGRFNPLLFEVDNADTLLGVLQLANKYLVRRLEGRIVSLVCSNMPVYFDAVIRSNSFLASRPLLVRCILHVCQEIINADKYELIIYFFKYISKQDFTELSIKLTNLYCIHNA